MTEPKSETPKRDWSLADGHGYMLRRSHAATCRLNLQFYLWKNALNFNIDKSIPIASNSMVADVATGTVMWPLDVSRELPGIHIDCFDNDLDQVPNQAWLPPNIKTRYWNIFEDPPADIVGKYDLVHVRLLVLVIEGGKRGPVIKNLAKLLKPGGYLQWDELDCVNMSVKRAAEGISAPALEELRQLSWSNGRHDWTVKLADFLAEEGFEDTRLEFYGDPPELVRAFNDQHLLTMEEFATFLTRVGKHEAAANFHQLIQDGYKEAAAGAAFCIPRVVAIGRKPS